MVVLVSLWIDLHLKLSNSTSHFGFLMGDLTDFLLVSVLQVIELLCLFWNEQSIFMLQCFILLKQVFTLVFTITHFSVYFVFEFASQKINLIGMHWLHLMYFRVLLLSDCFNLSHSVGCMVVLWIIAQFPFFLELLVCSIQLNSHLAIFTFFALKQDILVLGLFSNLSKQNLVL